MTMAYLGVHEQTSLHVHVIINFVVVITIMIKKSNVL